MPEPATRYGGLPSSSWPSKTIEPSARGISPMIALQRVVFPMPLRPITEIASAPISSSTSSRIWAWP